MEIWVREVRRDEGSLYRLGEGLGESERDLEMRFGGAEGLREDAADLICIFVLIFSY
jgi:hypothetical protein